MSPLHRLQSLDLMDDMPLTYCKEAHTNSPVLTTPIIEHNKIMTPRRQANHHQLHAMNSDLSSTSATMNQKNKSFSGNAGGSGSTSGINIVGGSSMLNCDGGMIGSSSFNAIASSSGAIPSSSSTSQPNQHHHYSHQQQSHSHRQSHHSHHQRNSYNSNKLDDGCGLRHRWHACPELHKAMDGVNYIADHTKKEEESTKVNEHSFHIFFFCSFSFSHLFSISLKVVLSFLFDCLLNLNLLCFTSFYFWKQQKQKSYKHILNC